MGLSENRTLPSFMVFIMLIIMFTHVPHEYEHSMGLWQGLPIFKHTLGQSPSDGDPGHIAPIGGKGRGQFSCHKSFGQRPHRGHHKEAQQPQQRASQGSTAEGKPSWLMPLMTYAQKFEPSNFKATFLEP